MKRRTLIQTLGCALGAAAVGASRARAAPPKLAIVYPGGTAEWVRSDPMIILMMEELARLGYVEGAGLSVTVISGDGQLRRQPALVDAVIAGAPSVIFVASRTLATRFKDITRSIPIVCFVADPIAAKLVTNMSKPGGNLTGVASDTGPEVYEKRLSLLREMGAACKNPGFLAPNNQDQSPFVSSLRARSSALSPLLIDSPINTQSIRQAFAEAVVEQTDAMVVSDATALKPYSELISALASERRIPTMYGHKLYAENGGLASYALRIGDLGRTLANQIAHILDGARAGDLPFVRPTRFDLVVNRKAATAIGLSLPQEFLAQVDEVIE